MSTWTDASVSMVIALGGWLDRMASKGVLETIFVLPGIEVFGD
jgi:hypothetical protein